MIDDALSSLDIRVKLHIMEECLVRYLKKKTRLFFTSTLQNLHKADRVVLME